MRRLELWLMFSFMIALLFIPVSGMAQDATTDLNDPPNNAATVTAPTELGRVAQKSDATLDVPEGSVIWLKIGQNPFYPLAPYGTDLPRDQILNNLFKNDEYARRIKENWDVIMQVMPGMNTNDLDKLLTDLRDHNESAFETSEVQYEGNFPAGGVYGGFRKGTKVGVIQKNIVLKDERLLSRPNKSAPALMWRGQKRKSADGIDFQPRMWLIVWCGNPMFDKQEITAEITVSAFPTDMTGKEPRRNRIVKRSPSKERSYKSLAFWLRLEGNALGTPHDGERLRMPKDVDPTVQKAFLTVYLPTMELWKNSFLSSYVEAGVRTNMTDKLTGFNQVGEVVYGDRPSIQPEFRGRVTLKQAIGNVDNGLFAGVYADLTRVLRDGGETTRDFGLSFETPTISGSFGTTSTDTPLTKYSQKPYGRVAVNLANLFEMGNPRERPAINVGVRAIFNEELIQKNLEKQDLFRVETKPHPLTVFVGYGARMFGGFLYSEVSYGRRKFSVYELPSDKLVAEDINPHVEWNVTWSVPLHAFYF